MLFNQFTPRFKNSTPLLLLRKVSYNFKIQVKLFIEGCGQLPDHRPLGAIDVCV